MNRRASVARDTPTSAASAATVQFSRARSWSSRSAGPTTGSPAAEYQPGAAEPDRVNQARTEDTTTRSNNRSRNTSWPGSSRVISHPSRETSDPSPASAGTTARAGRAVSNRRPTAASAW